jgi:hypothetical protein
MLFSLLGLWKPRAVARKFPGRTRTATIKIPIIQPLPEDLRKPFGGTSIEMQDSPFFWKP